MKSFITCIAAALVITACTVEKQPDRSTDTGQSSISAESETLEPSTRQNRPISRAEQTLGQSPFEPYVGRWETALNAVPDGKSIVVDIDISGHYTIDVRTAGAMGQSVIESATGQAIVENGKVKGTNNDTVGAHEILAEYRQWSMSTKDGVGVLTGTSGQPVAIGEIKNEG